MRSFGEDEPDFPVAGSNRVDEVTFRKGRIFINKNQYFDGIEQDVWDYQVGGYPLAEKYLKDRKGRHLTFNELAHYRRVIAAVRATRDIQDEIDETIPGWPLT